MIPGLAVLLGLGLLVGASLAGLWGAAPAQAGGAGLDYLGAIARFTLLQASWSTALSLAGGWLLALALARRRIPGRAVVVAFLGTATALPAIVVVLAITTIYGRSGLLNDMLAGIGLGRFSFYGLPGILIGHVFFNAAFAARVFLAGLEAVPGEHWRLAQSLGMPPAAVFRLIDLPVLRREGPPLALLVFMICATSFVIPLTLGGGPGAATLEVAIFQAIRFDADFQRAAVLALVQIGAAASLLLLALPLLRRPPEAAAAGRRFQRPDRASLPLRLLDALVLACAFLLFVPPLASVALAARSLVAGTDADLLRALATSLAVALPAAALALTAAVLIAGSRLALAEAGRGRLARLVGVAPLLVVATPPLAFAAGLFVLARHFGNPAAVAVPALILANAMLALPFAHRIVEPPLALASERYGRLAASLGMGFAARLRFVQAPLLAGPAAAAVAYAMALSLGDLGVVTLFGSPALVTLPALLYARLGAYRLAEAESIAAVLAALVLVLFLAAHRLGRVDARRG